MKNVCLSVPVFLIMMLVSSVYGAEDIVALSDKFYGGLASTIERYMDDPDKCVSEVEAYYQNNQALAAKIKEATEKAMAQIAPMMDEYMEMSQKAMDEEMTDEEIMALENKWKAKGIQQKPRDPSPGMARYSDAMNAFSAKHPFRGMKIAGFAMKLVPGFGQGMAQDESRR
ncbi:MAG: hypothetical protein ABID09_00760 [Candidatus Omnitrophota bacterium]